MMTLVHFSHPANLLLLLLAIPALLYPLYRRSKGSLPRRLVMILRTATAVLLVFALSGIQIARGKRQAAVVFVVDRSDSIAPAEKAAALEYLNKVASVLAPADEAGVVVFGREAVIEQRLQRNLSAFEIQSTPVSTSTNIAKGLSLARAMLASKPEASKRIILMTDGNQTSGDAQREASVAASEEIAIDVLPLATAAQASGRKIFLQEVSGPESIRLGEPFDIRIALRGNPNSNVMLRLYRDGTLISELARSVGSSGTEIFRLAERVTTAGFHQYQVKAQKPDKDRAEDADEDGLVVYAYGRTKILHLSDRPAAFLDDILRKQGFEVTASTPQQAPGTVQGMAPYDAIVLDNVPASSFSEDQMRAFAEHVERYAGGLIMIGGTGSFGPGGYSGTPVEKVLPVDMALRNREKKPALAVVLVLDKSGSMGMEQRKVSKIDMAKDAVLRLTELLGPEDSLGIIAFDRSPREVMPLHEGVDRPSVEAVIRTLSAGGGTSILPAVEMAYKWLDASTAEKKHVLLLSDGQADTAERKPLTDRVAGSRVILSTVGIGGDVDRALLQTLADRAHGRAYFTDTGLDLPDIFKREALLISGKWVVEHPFKPRQPAEHEILLNPGKAGLPEMTGYVAATPKKLSEILLTADNGDPILSCWRYGVGKTLVFTSDLLSPWTQQIVRWEYFAGMWTQMVRWAGRSPQSQSMHPRIVTGDDDAAIIIDSFDSSGNFANFTGVHARIEAPDSTSSELDLAQKASGNYEGRFPIRGKGNYLFTVVGKMKGATENALHFGFSLSRSSEDRQLSNDPQFLAKLATVESGKILKREVPPQFPETNSAVYLDMWQVAAAAAMLLFLLDVVLRRGFARAALEGPERVAPGKRSAARGRSFQGGRALKGRQND